MSEPQAFSISVDSQPTKTLPLKMDHMPDVEDDSRTTSEKVLDIIYEHRLTKAALLANAHDKWVEGTPKFLGIIDGFVKTGREIQMCLPAFPFKSANKVDKVLGISPDKAEEAALEYMNDMCNQIGAVYSPGAKLLIISDGLVYNDLLTIPDKDVWAYGQELRAMGASKFPHIEFSRLRQLVDIDLPEKLDEVTYVANATNFRHALLTQHGKDDLDVYKLIEQNEDTRLTYCGHSRFLFNDLRYIFPKSDLRGSNQYKRDVKFIAREMIRRGFAFAAAINKNFPEHLRLSIHQSTGEHKVSISLLPTETSYTTPWMCAVAYDADGTLTSGPKIDFEADPKYEIVYQDMRRSYFIEKTESTAALTEVTGNQMSNEVHGAVELESTGQLEGKLATGPCPHCGKCTHAESRCFDKYPHLAPKWVQKRMASSVVTNLLEAASAEDTENKAAVTVN